MKFYSLLFFVLSFPLVFSNPVNALSKAKSSPTAATPAVNSRPEVKTDAHHHPWKNYKKPTKAELKKQLPRQQFSITQEEGTETPFANQYWNNKAEGIYVDVLSGEPLFSSTHKFQSGTGWPSFYQPIDNEFIANDSDHKLGYERTEVRSKYGDNHLGHVFDDGPKPTGKRYCINSAALRFVPKAEMEKLGYGDYLSLFKSPKK